MSIIPIRTAFSNFYPFDYNSAMMNPSRLFDQHFGMGVDPFSIMPNYMRAMAARVPETGVSQVINDKNKFQVNLDVRHFKPEEINVKVVDDYLIIEGKHEEKMDEHGFVSRQFTRKYLIPKDVDAKALASSLSHEGILTMEAPKLALSETKARTIPIQQKPAPAVEGGKK